MRGPGKMRANTYMREHLDLLGVQYDSDKDYIYTKLPETIEEYRPSWEARELMARVFPKWPVERQLEFERSVSVESLARELDW